MSEKRPALKSFDWLYSVYMCIFQLILLGGGTVLSREPKLESLSESFHNVPYHAQPGSLFANCCHFILNANRKEPLRMLSSHLCSTSGTWLVDCVADFSLVEPILHKS